MTYKNIIHKSDTFRYYKSIPIHAAGGVHEAVASLIQNLCNDGQKILELGAGSGAMTARLIDSGYDVTPVDLDPSTWMCAGTSVVSLDLNQHNWIDGLEQREYPCVVAVEIIEHLENPKQFLRQLFKATVPNGVCIITTPNILCADSVNRMIRKESFYGFDRVQYFETGHISILPWWLVHLFAEEAGFAVEHTELVGKMDKRGVKLSAIRLFSRALHLVRPKNGPRILDDGIVSVVVLRRGKL